MSETVSRSGERMENSPLWNADLAPAKAEKKTWGLWNFVALWVGMSVCIPTYMLAGGLIGAGMNWWQAVITIFIANCIVLIPMILNGAAGAKYGIPFPVLARASFGTYGSNIPCMMRALVACGWFGIQTWIGGSAVYGLHLIWTPDLVAWLDGFGMIAGITVGHFTAFILFWFINMIFVWSGTEAIRWLEVFAAPFLIAIGLALLAWAVVRAGGLGTILSESSRMQGQGSFSRLFFPMLTAMVGFWATLSLNISDFTRFAKSQKDQVVGQAIGLPSTMTLYSFIGIAVTSATILIFGEAIWDPVLLLQRFDSPLLIMISLFSLSVATVSTNIAANVVSPANDFSNLAPRYISFRIGGTIAGIIGILIMPWKLLSSLGDYIFTWLIGYSALLGPVAAILICDFFLIRKRQLNVEDLYLTNGRYGKWNWRGIVALFVGILPNVPGFLQAATHGGPMEIKVPQIFNEIYVFAWFVGFAVAFGVYLLLSQNSSNQGAGATEPDAEEPLLIAPDADKESIV